MPKLPSAVRAAFLLAGLACAAPAAAVSDGPLDVDTPGPMRGLFLDMPLGDARVPSTLRLDLRWSLANDWSRGTVLVRGADVVRVQGDAQADVLRLAITVPWSRFGGGELAARTSTTVEGRLIAWWGGWTDRPIEAWHRLIGSWNFQRERYPRNAVHLVLAQDGGPRLADVEGTRIAPGDLALRTQVQLAGALDPSARFALAARLDLKLPTGALSAFTGSGGPDAGLGLGLTWRPAEWLTVHGLASGRIVSGLPHGLALQPRRLQGGLDLGLVARLGRSVALVLEDRVSTPLVEAGWQLPEGTQEPEATAWYALDRPHNQISGGLRIRELTIFFSEDFTPGSRLSTDPGPRWFYNSNAPDFVLGVAWSAAL